MRKEFTIENAIEIQLEQINRWSSVLKTEAYLELLKEATKRNKKGYKSPSDVFRGVDIDNFIHNNLMKG
jgi:hypothetical protein